MLSEIDYAFYAARETLSVGPADARGYMLRTAKWKYVHFKGFPPQLFDLETDPDEFNDLGQVPEFETIRQSLHRRLTDRLIDRKNRVGMTDDTVLAMRAGENASGVIIGVWEEHPA